MSKRNWGTRLLYAALLGTGMLVIPATITLYPLPAVAQGNIPGGFDYAKYRDAVTGAESGRDYSVMNTVTGSAAGAYQFIPSTLGALGYLYSTNGSWAWENVSWTSKATNMGVSSLDDFRYTAAGRSLQDRAMDEFTYNNWRAISSGSKSYIGKLANNVVVTEGGLLSLAHWLGAGGANEFIAEGFDFSGMTNRDQILRQNFPQEPTVDRANRYAMHRIAIGAQAHGGVPGTSGSGNTGNTPYTADDVVAGMKSGSGSGGSGGYQTVSGVCQTYTTHETAGEAVSSPYGVSRSLQASAGYHQGLDIVNAPRRGSPIYSGVPGKVVVRGSGSGGNRVVIETSDGAQRWVFMHLDAINPQLKIGDTVTADTQIGTMGNSGTSAVHLHLSSLIRGDKLQAAGINSRIWKSPSGWGGSKEEPALSADEIATAIPDNYYFVNPETFLHHRMPFQPGLVEKYASQGLDRPDNMTLAPSCSVQLTDAPMASTAGMGVGGDELGANAIGKMADMGYGADQAMAELRDTMVDLTKIAADDFTDNLRVSQDTHRPAAAIALLISEMQKE